MRMVVPLAMQSAFLSMRKALWGGDERGATFVAQERTGPRLGGGALEIEVGLELAHAFPPATDDKRHGTDDPCGQGNERQKPRGPESAQDHVHHVELWVFDPNVGDHSVGGMEEGRHDSIRL
jgi:hypothetical protein